MSDQPQAAKVPVQEAMAALLDAGSAHAMAQWTAGAVAALSGEVGGRPVLAAAVDSGVARGALGADEAAVLRDLAQSACARRLPLVLGLDSAGARLDQGIDALAAFRGLYRAMVAAKAAGVPIVALVGRNCFGGASMLACLAHRRIWRPDSLLGMSGPAIVAALDTDSALDARNRAAVAGLFGAPSRLVQDAAAGALADGPDATRRALLDALAQLPATVPWAFESEHRSLLSRLGASGIEIPRTPRPPDPALARRLGALFDGGFATVLGDGVLRGVQVRQGSEVSVAGVMGGAPITAAAAWMVAESIVTSVRARPDRAIVVFYDSPGHAMTRADEALTLSDYIAHLAEAVQWAALRGVPVTLAILGEASGGGYVALAAPASRVYALPGADVQVLPRVAVDRVIARGAPADGPEPDRWVGLGIADAVLREDRWPEDAVRGSGA